jgi:hypothetical protein
MLITITTTWFAINVLMAPLSFGMQEDLMRIRFLFH